MNTSLTRPFALTLSLVAVAAGWAASPASADRGVNRSVDASGPVSGALAGDGRAELFARAFEQSGLGRELGGGAPWTLFVPGDAALRREGLDFLLDNVLLSADNAERLDRVLGYHAVRGVRLDGASIEDPVTLDTLAHSPLTVDRAGGVVRIDGHALVIGRFEARNGVVYLIDRMLWPEKWPR